MARLYDEILTIARNYMGAAAEDYIRRRIRIVQQGRSPETIDASRLDRLAAGIDMTAKGYMTEAKAESFRDEIQALKEHFPATETADDANGSSARQQDPTPRRRTTPRLSSSG